MHKHLYLMNYVDISCYNNIHGIFMDSYEILLELRQYQQWVSRNRCAYEKYNVAPGAAGTCSVLPVNS